MDQYALREDYQKQMDSVADRFYKGVNLTVLVFLTFTWAMLSSDKALMKYPLMIGIMILIGGFIVLGSLQAGAVRAIGSIRSAYEIDHRNRFFGMPPFKLTGLFS